MKFPLASVSSLLSATSAASGRRGARRSLVSFSFSAMTRRSLTTTHLPINACNYKSYKPPPNRNTTIRFASSKDDGPQFDADMSRLYKIVAENHRHPSGPWVTMLDKVHAYADARHTQTFSVLDLATGPGEPAESIARQFPACTVVATDISPDQVALAEQTAATLPHMTCQVANMEDLCDFADGSFDLVTCCYGFMFPPDIPQAVAEAHRVLKPGGQLIATTWNEIGVMKKVRAVMEIVLGQTPPAPPINPLSLSEAGLFESMLRDAGFAEDLDVTTHEYPFDMTADPETQFQASMIPVRDTLDELEAWDKAKEAYEAVKMNHGAFNEHGHWIIPGNVYKLTVATKPLQE